jgi:hypothetical protein
MKKKIAINADDEKSQENNRWNFVQVPAMTKPIPLPKEKADMKADGSEAKQDS